MSLAPSRCERRVPPGLSGVHCRSNVTYLFDIARALKSEHNQLNRAAFFGVAVCITLERCESILKQVAC